ncbi:MAG: hypothetical protein FJW38_10330 [Acidobacteria bacterium]|nr:hypothetical protein [Acidobacteriota bacterium]
MAKNCLNRAVWPAFLASRPNIPATHTPDVCPNAEKPSEWAARALHFTPSKLQAEILNYQGDRLILCCARQWGKSTIIAVKALHEAVHNPGTTTIILSRTKSQADVILQRIRANAAALDLPLKRHHGREHSIAFPNGSAIFAIAHNAETAVGYTANTLIVDEAAVVSDETFAAVLPCIAHTNGKLWMLSTPNGQKGTFYTIWHDKALSHWRRVKATVDDLDYANKEIVNLQLRLYPAKAKQDFFCEFVQPAGRLVSAELFKNFVDPTRTTRRLPDLD